MCVAAPHCLLHRLSFYSPDLQQYVTLFARVNDVGLISHKKDKILTTTFQGQLALRFA